MKRVRHGASSASAAKRSSAAGSRSTAMSSPSGPRRPATSRAWPPPPKVQSTATSPGCGSRTSISSPASTGTWVAVMSTRIAKTAGDVGKFIRKRLVVGGPRGASPDLQALAGAGHDDVLRQLAVLEQEARDADTTCRVELGVQRVGGEEPVQLARLLRQRVLTRERRGHVGVVGLRRPDLHAPLDPLREDDALAQRSPELGRDRQPVLGVEGVVEGAAEGHLSSRAPRGEEWTRTEVEEWEEPLHPGPHAALVPHYPPLRNPPCTFSPTDVVGLTPEGPNPPLRRAIPGWETVRPRALPSRNARCVRAGC